MPRTTSEDSELYALRGDNRHLFYAVHSETTTEDSWRSHYEEGNKPRQYEIVNAMDHMGLSMWEDPEPLRMIARRYPQIGTFLAEVVIDGSLGVWFAETGPEGHYTVWGRPADLQRCVHLPAVPV